MIATAEPEFRSALTTSFIMHGVIFLALIFGLPHMRPEPIQMAQPIAIDIVDVGPVTTTQQQAQGQIAKKNDLAPAPIPTPPKPMPAPAKPTPKPAPTQAQAKPKAAPKVDDKDALSSLIKSESKKAKAKAKDDKKDDQTDQQFGSLLKNLSKPNTAAATGDAKAPPTPQAAAGSTGIVSNKLTISEEDLLRRQIEQCWNVPVGARDAQNLIIELHLLVNPDRTVQTVDIVDNGQMGDPFYRAAAESARRAVLNPKCSPLQLPEGKEEMWKSMTLRFNPQDVL